MTVTKSNARIFRSRQCHPRIGITDDTLENRLPADRCCTPGASAVGKKRKVCIDNRATARCETVEIDVRSRRETLQQPKRDRSRICVIYEQRNEEVEAVGPENRDERDEQEYDRIEQQPVDAAPLFCIATKRV
jgi:hypothetical protein